MTAEVTTFALLTGSVTDAITGTPLSRSALSVRLLEIGAPPAPSDAIWARSYSESGFVIAADAGRIGLDDPSSSGPDPKHLVGTFDLHFVLAANGYADLPVTVGCNHDAVPLTASYALTPGPFAIRGRVTTGNPPVAAGGVSVDITAATPPITAPGPVLTAADGTYAFPSVPAARSVTLGVSGQSQTVEPAYPVLTVNFAL
jgi:hypothetical protein